MKTTVALGLLAGGFLVVPMGLYGVVVIWVVAKVHPVAGTGLFVASLVADWVVR